MDRKYARNIQSKYFLIFTSSCLSLCQSCTCIPTHGGDDFDQDGVTIFQLANKHTGKVTGVCTFHTITSAQKK